MLNLITLKAQMLVEGVNVDDTADALFRRQNPSNTKRGGLSSGGKMRLAGGVLVNAPFYRERRVPISIVADPMGDMRVEVRHGDEVLCTAEVLSAPDWYTQTVDEFPITKILTAHNRQLAGSVYEDCAFFAHANACQFCVMRWSLAEKPVALLRKRGDLFVRTLERIPLEKYAGLTLNGGTTLHAGRGMELMVPVVEAVHRAFPDFPIGIEITPPADLDWIDRLADTGCASLMMNLECWDMETRRLVIPGKEAVCPRDSYFRAFERALVCFGKGRVSTCFVVGTESVATLKEGIREVVAAGVVPSPLSGRYFEDVPGYSFRPEATVEEFLDVLRFAAHEMRGAGIASSDTAGCVACGMCDLIRDTF